MEKDEDADDAERCDNITDSVSMRCQVMDKVPQGSDHQLSNMVIKTPTDGTTSVRGDQGLQCNHPMDFVLHSSMTDGINEDVKSTDISSRIPISQPLLSADQWQSNSAGNVALGWQINSTNCHPLNNDLTTSKSRTNVNSGDLPSRIPASRSVGQWQSNSAGDLALGRQINSIDHPLDNDQTTGKSRTNVRTARKSYECFECNQTFSHSSSLARHTLVHSGLKQYTCDVCRKSFAQPGHLDIHKRTHSGDKPYRCDVCDKSFVDSTHLVRHKRIHDDRKRYPCDRCDKAFRQLGTLKIHQRTHSGHRPFKCDVCQKGFVDSTHLTIHKRHHTGERPYVCPVCQKSFLNCSHLNRHKLIHLDEKPPTCEICHKTFAKRTSLTVHKRIHTSSKAKPTEASPTVPAVTPATSRNVGRGNNTAPEAAVSPPGLLARPPFMGMMGPPMLGVSSALLRLPGLSKLAQMRDAAK